MNALHRLASAARDGRLLSGLSRRYLPLFAPLREYRHRASSGLSLPKCEKLPWIALHGDFYAEPIGALVKQSLEQALCDIGGPPAYVRAIEGMSGQKYRTFINNLVGAHPDPRYLEIGSWLGSTATAALCGNAAAALCIDNWSEFGGPRDRFFANIAVIRSPAIDFRFIEKDFRRVDFTAIGRFNIFLFDGPHREADHYDGLMLARPALEHPFVLIVDDWNAHEVRPGVLRALHDAGYTVSCAVEIRTTNDDSYPAVTGKESDWHNGYFVAVISA